jgi:alkylhydroperoxidase family enzyme
MQLPSLFLSAFTLGSIVAMVCAEAMTEEITTDDAHARQELILGKPPRIQPLEADEFTEEARRVIDSMSQLSFESSVDSRPEAEVTEMLATMVRHPELYGSHIALAKLFLTKGTLSPRDRELAILRTGWLCQAPYEWGEHVKLAKQAGVSTAEIERVTQGSAAPGWSDHDRAILRAAEELRHDAMLSDETWAVLAASLDDRQLIELVMLVGQYQTIAYYQNALRLRLRDGNEGLSAR